MTIEIKKDYKGGRVNRTYYVRQFQGWESGPHGLPISKVTKISTKAYNSLIRKHNRMNRHKASTLHGFTTVYLNR